MVEANNLPSPNKNASMKRIPLNNKSVERKQATKELLVNSSKG